LHWRLYHRTTLFAAHRLLLLRLPMLLLLLLLVLHRPPVTCTISPMPSSISSATLHLLLVRLPLCRVPNL
jgi:hypothetical protein